MAHALVNGAAAAAAARALGGSSGGDAAGPLPWAVIIALIAAAVAVLAAGGSCLAAAVASGIARARARRSAGGKAPRGGVSGGVNGAGAAAAALLSADDAAKRAAWRAWLWRCAGLAAAAAPLAPAAAAGGGGKDGTAAPLRSHPLAWDAAEEPDDEGLLAEGSPRGAAPQQQQQPFEQQQPGGAAPPSPGPAPPQPPRSLWARARGRVGPALSSAVRAADNARALVASAPRTLRTLGWAVSSGLSYKRFLMTHDSLMDPEGYQKGLSALHDYWAEVRRGGWGRRRRRWRQGGGGGAPAAASLPCVPLLAARGSARLAPLSVPRLPAPDRGVPPQRRGVREGRPVCGGLQLGAGGVPQTSGAAAGVGLRSGEARAAAFGGAASALWRGMGLRPAGVAAGAGGGALVQGLSQPGLSQPGPQPPLKKHPSTAPLQDKAKPRPFSTVNRVLRCELGASAEEVFAEFSAEATAAASLAQVRRAGGRGGLDRLVAWAAGASSLQRRRACTAGGGPTNTAPRPGRLSPPRSTRRGCTTAARWPSRSSTPGSGAGRGAGGRAAAAAAGPKTMRCEGGSRVGSAPCPQRPWRRPGGSLAPTPPARRPDTQSPGAPRRRTCLRWPCSLTSRSRCSLTSTWAGSTRSCATSWRRSWVGGPRGRGWKARGAEGPGAFFPACRPLAHGAAAAAGAMARRPCPAGPRPSRPAAPQPPSCTPPPDFGVEIAHSRRLMAILSRGHDVVVPHIHSQLCTSKVRRPRRGPPHPWVLSQGRTCTRPRPGLPPSPLLHAHTPRSNGAPPLGTETSTAAAPRTLTPAPPPPPQILVMEWITGYKINDVRALRRARISTHAVGLKVRAPRGRASAARAPPCCRRSAPAQPHLNNPPARAPLPRCSSCPPPPHPAPPPLQPPPPPQLERAFAEMTFVHGYLHADPHPGNILIRPTGGHPPGAGGPPAGAGAAGTATYARGAGAHLAAPPAHPPAPSVNPRPPPLPRRPPAFPTTQAAAAS
jgi:hypothetical protein